MSLIAAAKKHFEDQGLQSVSIPEWDTSIYWRPLTVGETMRIDAKAENPFESTIYTIMEKALDAHGNKVFSAGDKDDLMNRVDVEILSRIALAIRGEDPGEEEAKNV